MARSQRRLILDRMENSVNAINDNIRRLEEVMGFYMENMEGVEKGQGGVYDSYVRNGSIIQELIKAENSMLTAYAAAQEVL